MKLDWSARGRARVWTLMTLGTLVCIALAFAIDSFDVATGRWRWGSDPINNFVIPAIVAPPIFFFMLDKMRQLAIAHTELMTVASTDSLTSLLNRRAFTELVDGYLKRVVETGITTGGEPAARLDGGAPERAGDRPARRAETARALRRPTSESGAAGPEPAVPATDLRKKSRRSIMFDVLVFDV